MPSITKDGSTIYVDWANGDSEFSPLTMATVLADADITTSEIERLGSEEVFLIKKDLRIRGAFVKAEGETWIFAQDKFMRVETRTDGTTNGGVVRFGLPVPERNDPSTTATGADDNAQYPVVPVASTTGFVAGDCVEITLGANAAVYRHVAAVVSSTSLKLDRRLPQATANNDTIKVCSSFRDGCTLLFDRSTAPSSSDATSNSLQVATAGANWTASLIGFYGSQLRKRKASSARWALGSPHLAGTGVLGFYKCTLSDVHAFVVEVWLDHFACRDTTVTESAAGFFPKAFAGNVRNLRVGSVVSTVQVLQLGATYEDVNFPRDSAGVRMNETYATTLVNDSPTLFSDGDVSGLNSVDDEVRQQFRTQFVVQDATGAALAGAGVTITNALGTVVFSGTTDAAGQIPVQMLVRKRWYYASGAIHVETHTPHTITIAPPAGTGLASAVLKLVADRPRVDFPAALALQAARRGSRTAAQIPLLGMVPR